MCLCVNIQRDTYLGKVKCKWDKNANQGGETYRTYGCGSYHPSNSSLFLKFFQNKTPALLPGGNGAGQEVKSVRN